MAKDWQIVFVAVALAFGSLVLGLGLDGAILCVMWLICLSVFAAFVIALVGVLVYIAWRPFIASVVAYVINFGRATQNLFVQLFGLVFFITLLLGFRGILREIWDGIKKKMAKLPAAFDAEVESLPAEHQAYVLSNISFGD